MTDAHDEVARLEAEIDAVAERIENGRKLSLLARGLVAAGCGTLLLLLTGILRGSPAGLVFGIAALLGGFTLMGSNRTSIAELRQQRDRLQAQRASVISGMELRVVS